MVADIPAAFVWTKIKDYSGQGMRLILNRKELERQSGGTFWWGIGESKADKIMLLVAREGRPPVLFSEMPSAAHRRDTNPDGVLLWEQAKDKRTLPPHVLLMSRAHQSNGKIRERYYALVCESPSGIPHTGGGVLNRGSLRNFGDSGRSIGSSQITAVAEQTGRTANGRSYPITFRATLVPPYVVQIAAPRLLSADERRLLDEVSRDGKTAEDWIAVAKRLRRSSPQDGA